ncbi:hypothetical protein ASPVEDRAFT_80228 [Aspergillus versicolor CBS 583.65]|uniref:Rhodopsin domain-containing protein n=1 Tax=Aspergillus versicolor CBS 583.65 TaxID=1036611 RepID=A0A1L9PAM5_ASPVE|nr:uncharacterized protein ASPVEDRAFT_80228 [Aspergillus versicolor CBS 583.65]OJI98587.1 hypothetical protein ASPVEDRAFT_80228 [Aspergillus versicolor CBS 583.65]
MSSREEEDPAYGEPFVYACWALTGLVSAALIFRYTVKAWAGRVLPTVSSPTRIWGAEDLLFVIGYGFDIAHMTLIQISLNYGLGRHIWFLTDEQRIGAMKYDFLSQPLAVTASMFSRCGMTWFLYTCFSSLDRQIRIAIIVGMAIQVVANSVTVLQIVLQCGPNPYYVTNRGAYFHYMWDGVPTDGSVVCQSPNVQTTVGFVQGGFNATVDFFLTILSAMQLWQFSIRAVDHSPEGSNSFLARFKRMPRQARKRRIWQTTILSGPLALSGCASIVKTYLLKSLGERNDFTHNIMSFVLWVKIENYCILLATCGPIVRLFVRVIFNNNKKNHSTGKYGYFSNSRRRQYPSDGRGDGSGGGIDKDPHSQGSSNTQSQTQGSIPMSILGDKGIAEYALDYSHVHGDGRPSTGLARRGTTASTTTTIGAVRPRASTPHPKMGRSDDDRGCEEGRGKGVTVKTDITVRVDEDGTSTTGLVHPRYDN